MPNFSTKVEEAVVALTSLPPRHVDENDFIDASRLVYDGVREVRRAVLLNRAEEEIDTDTDWEEEGADMGEVAVGGEGGSVRPQVESRTDSVIDEYPNISGIRVPFFVIFFVTGTQRQFERPRS
jgi:catenin alpha